MPIGIPRFFVPTEDGCSPVLLENKERAAHCATRSCFVFVVICLDLLAHVHLGGDLGGEVLLLLLDALTGHEANGLDELHGAAQLLGGVSDVLLTVPLKMSPRTNSCCSRQFSS